MDIAINVYEVIVIIHEVSRQVFLLLSASIFDRRHFARVEYYQTQHQPHSLLAFF